MSKVNNKNIKTTSHGGVLLLAKLQAEALNIRFALPFHFMLEKNQKNI